MVKRSAESGRIEKKDPRRKRKEEKKKRKKEKRMSKKIHEEEEVAMSIIIFHDTTIQGTIRGGRRSRAVILSHAPLHPHHPLSESVRERVKHAVKRSGETK